MPRQNRVTPQGELIAVPDRGLFWGNRGALLDGHGAMARYSRGRLWIICVLSFKGRQRQQWQPGRLTELYFLDEATGLAAGHRPCGECRHHEYLAYKQAFAAAVTGGRLAGAPEMDVRLQADRLTGPGRRRTYQAPLAGLPDGAMIEAAGTPWLVWGGELLAWTPGGYTERRRPGTTDELVTVITPRATVAVLGAGYRPAVHPSAGVSALDPQDQPVVRGFVAGLAAVAGEHVRGHVREYRTAGAEREVVAAEGPRNDLGAVDALGNHDRRDGIGVPLRGDRAQLELPAVDHGGAGTPREICMALEYVFQAFLGQHRQ